MRTSFPAALNDSLQDWGSWLPGQAFEPDPRSAFCASLQTKFTSDEACRRRRFAASINLRIGPKRNAPLLPFNVHRQRDQRRVRERSREAMKSVRSATRPRAVHAARRSNESASIFARLGGGCSCWQAD